MRAYVGVTDGDWYQFLHARPDLDEVNFWQPSGRRAFRALNPGDIFLFKLHYPEHAIVGGGTFLYANSFPFSIAWEAFGEKNGADTRDQMRSRIERYRRTSARPNEDYVVGCIIIKDPFFLDERDWIPPPSDWQPNIVQGKAYDLSSETGRRLWEDVLLRKVLAPAEESIPESPLFGEPALVRPRLGQGSFRMVVTDAYQRRCAVTKERALPVLQAAHIRPVSDGGRHEVSNGLLLRSDIHTLFDRGYITITPDHELQISQRLRDEFHNGEEYFAMRGTELSLPTRERDQPNQEFLEWHNTTAFRG